MNRKKKRVRYQSRLYRSDDLLDILAEEIPIKETGLLEVLGLLARRKVLLDPQVSLRRPALPDDHYLVNETRSNELEDVEPDWRTVFNVFVSGWNSSRAGSSRWPRPLSRRHAQFSGKKRFLARHSSRMRNFPICTGKRVGSWLTRWR